MQHYKRGTTIDVHHNILPQTIRYRPDSNKLLDQSVHLGDGWVLSNEDKVIQSATHLFHEGELEHGLRDLSDLDLLLKEFSIQENFWVNLLNRSVELNQQISLYYALRYTTKILNTPVPEQVINDSKRNLTKKINDRIMDFLFLRALMPVHESCNDRWTSLARWILFVRSHWLRMPVFLLIPHLLRKSLKRFKSENHH